MQGRGWIALTGALSIIAGLVALVFPGITLLALAVVLSVWLLVFRAMEIVLALRLHSAA